MTISSEIDLLILNLMVLERWRIGAIAHQLQLHCMAVQKIISQLDPDWEERLDLKGGNDDSPLGA